MANKCRVWVGCLASYNAGSLHGEWVDVDGDVDTLHEAVQAILKSSPSPNAEEWHICDTEGFGGIEIGRYESLTLVAATATLLDERGAVCVKHAMGRGYTGCKEISEFLEIAHMGHYESKQAYAEECLGVDEMSDDDPKVALLLRYFDFDRYIHGELECAGVCFESDGDGGYHVFQPV